MRRLRVLVVDDSSVCRAQISQVVNRLETAEVVAFANNGADALRMVRERSPDAITVDLEMPGMDGFSFLRVLMATHPLPVIVVSSDSRRDSVLRALELGALDFVVKTDGEPHAFEAVLAQKLLLVRSAKMVRPSLSMMRPVRPLVEERRDSGVYRAPRYVVGIAASTGGPGALMDVFAKMEGLSQFAFVIAQHMPARFTTTFAQRLNRQGLIAVSEASDGQLLGAGTALLCPGDHCMVVEKRPDNRLAVRLERPAPQDRYIPNASRLLASVGEVAGVRAIAVVLTGMGDDGATGAKLISDKGGRVFVESENTAVISSMPDAAARAVPTAVRVPLEEVAESLVEIVSPRRR